LGLDLEEFREDEDADAGSESRSEVLPPAEQSESTAAEVEPLRYHHRFSEYIHEFYI
ncbi:hypothetical protein LINPERHAP1_LOCUS30881, partial [Linum perenne]